MIVISPAGDPDSRVILVNYVLHNSLSEMDFHGMKVSYVSCVSAGFIVRMSYGERVGNDSRHSYFTGARAPDNPRLLTNARVC